MRVKFEAFVACVLLLCSSGCGGQEGRREQAERRAVVSRIESILREGDLVFRRGHGLTSRAVLLADDGGIYSHTGIVVRDGTGDGAEWRIVHIVPGEPDEKGVKDRIKMESPEQFFAPVRAKRGAVVRVGNSGYGGTDTAGISEIATRAAQRAKKMVSTLVMFDYKYDLDDTVRVYCTELVRNVFMHEGLDITDGKRSHIGLPGFGGDYILPGDLLGSRYVMTIYEF